jgi:hypothetical protein
VINFQNIFHTGFLVHDLYAEMTQYERALGIRWAKPYTYEALNIWTPEEGVHQIELQVAYSADGPQHIEIQKGPSGSVYDRNLHSGHHVGLWVDDVATKAAPMIAAGWKIVVSSLPPENGFGTFIYLRPPNAGMLVELVNVAAKPRFDRWWGGADGPF